MEQGSSRLDSQLVLDAHRQGPIILGALARQLVTEGVQNLQHLPILRLDARWDVNDHGSLPSGVNNGNVLGLDGRLDDGLVLDGWFGLDWGLFLVLDWDGRRPDWWLDWDGFVPDWDGIVPDGGLGRLVPDGEGLGLGVLDWDGVPWGW